MSLEEKGIQDPLLSKSEKLQEKNDSKEAFQVQLTEPDPETQREKKERAKTKALEQSIQEMPNSDLISTEIGLYNKFLRSFEHKDKSTNESDLRRQSKLNYLVSDDLARFKKYVDSIYDKAKEYIHEPIRRMDTLSLSDRKEIRGIALSPDQSRLLTGGLNKKLYLFEISKLNSVPETFDIKESVFAVAYSPKGDRILAGTGKGLIIVIDLRTKQEIWRIPLDLDGKDLDKYIRTVAFSADGESFFIGSDLGALVHFIPNGSEEFEKKKVIEHEDGVCAYAYSSAVKKHATGGNDKILNIFSYDEKSGKTENIIRITRHKGIVRSVAFSNDGKFVLSGSYDKTAKLFDTETGMEVMTYRGHSESVFAVAISPNSKYILTGSEDNSAKLFDRESGEALFNYDNFGKGKDKVGFDIRAVLFFGDGSRLIIAGEEGIAKVFSIEENQFYRGHSRHHIKLEKKDINCLDVSAQLDKVVTGGDDNTVRLYDLETGFELRSFEGSEGPINVVKFSPDSKMVLSGGNDYILRLYDSFSGALICSYQNHTENINCIEFSHSGNEFASGSEDKTVNIYNIFTRQLAKTLPEESQRNSENILIRCMLYTPDDNWIVVGGYETTKVSGMEFISRTHKDGITRVKAIESEENEINSMLLLKGGDALAALSNNELFIVNFEIESEIKIKFAVRLISSEENPIYNSLSSFGNFLFISSDESSECSTIQTWDLEDLEKPGLLLKTENLTITSNIAFLGENKLIFGCYGGRPVVMNIEREQGRPIKLTKTTFFDCSEEVENLTIDESGSKIALYSNSRQIKVLDLFTGRLLEEMLYENEESGAINAAAGANNAAAGANNAAAGLEEEKKNDNEVGQGLESVLLPENIKKEENQIKCLKFSMDSEHLLLGTAEGEVLIYKVSEMKNKKPLLKENLLQEFGFEAAGGVRRGVRLLEFSEENEKRKLLFCGFDSGEIIMKEVVSNVVILLKSAPDQTMDSKGSQLILNPYRTMNDDRTPETKKLLVLYKDGSLESFEIEKLLQKFKGEKEEEYVINAPKNRYRIDKEKSSIVIPLNKTKAYSNTNPFQYFRAGINWTLSSVVLNSLKEPLTCACSSNDFSKIIMGGEDKLVRVYDVMSKGEVIFKGHEDKICSVSFFADMKYGVSASEDQVIKVFEISGKELFNYKMDMRINKLCVSPVMDTIVLGTDCGLRIIYKVLTPRSKINSFYKTGTSLKRNFKDFDLAQELKNDSFDLLPIQLDLSLLHLRLAYAQKDSKIEVLKEVAEILKNPEVEQEIRENLCECIFRKDAVNKISPWEIWISEANETKHMEQVIYERLLDILLCPEMVHIERMDQKAKFIEKIAQRCPGKLQEVLDAFWKSAEDLTIRMHRMTPWMYVRYYWSQLLGMLDIIGFRKISLRKLVLPLVLHTKSPTPCNRIMEKKFEHLTNHYSNEQHNDKDVSFVNSYVKVSKLSLDEIINLDYYDQFKEQNEQNKKSKNKSSKFLLELFSSFQPEDPVFKSELLATVVNYLWKLPECIGYAFYRRLIVFFIFQLLICINCLHFIPQRQAIAESPQSDPNNRDLKEFYKWLTTICDATIIFIFGFSFVYRNLKLLRLFMMYGREHFKFSTVFSLWNMLDYGICVLGCFVFGLDLYWNAHLDDEAFEKNEAWTKGLLALFFATAWFKLIEFARGFTSTSALLRLLYQVTKDMLVYLLIILFMVIGVAFTRNSGEFKDEKHALNSELYFVALFFSSLYLVIIMLNLLIAIINNSFGNVLAKERQNEIFEKLKIINNRIYEFTIEEKETLRKKIEDDFLFQISTNTNENTEEEQNSKMEDFQNVLRNSTKKQEKLEKAIENQLKFYNQRFLDLESNLLTQIKKMNEISIDQIKRIFEQKAAEGFKAN